MDLVIQDRLNEYFNNLDIEVEYSDLRKYKIFIVLNQSIYKYLFKYDAHLTLDANIDLIRKEIEKCILNYYKK